MGTLNLSKQLQFGMDKYMITEDFYNYLITQTNYIKDYASCCSFVRKEINKARFEAKEVTIFPNKKIDFEL